MGPVHEIGSADGLRIAYETHGDGAPALVFVHGWSCDRSYWAGQLGPFSREFQVVAIDLVGHGASDIARQAWSIPAFGDDVAAVANQLDLERIVLIGHSMGGDVIMEAARRLPGRVAGLIWVDVYTSLGSPRTDEQLEAGIAPFRADFVEGTRAFVRRLFIPDADPTLIESVVEDMASAPPAVALATLHAARSYEREMPRVIAELGLPLIAINPDYRPTDRASLGRHGIEVMIMPRSGHFLMMEDPERFNALLREAIDRLPR